MKRVSLILFLMLVSLANLVFAADWHEPAPGDSLAVSAEVEQSLHSDLSDANDPAERPHAHGGNCIHSHGCPAHAHLFSIDTEGYRPSVVRGLRWTTVHLPLPSQHFMAPDVPPPIA